MKRRADGGGCWVCWQGRRCASYCPWALWGPAALNTGPWRQGWASTLASRSNARHRSKTRPSIERSERLYFFEKPMAKIVPSSAIVVDLCRSRFLGINFYTFNVKKHCAYLSRLYRNTYLISIDFHTNCICVVIYCNGNNIFHPIMVLVLFVALNYCWTFLSNLFRWQGWTKTVFTTEKNRYLCSFIAPPWRRTFLSTVPDERDRQNIFHKQKANLIQLLYQSVKRRDYFNGNLRVR